MDWSAYSNTQRLTRLDEKAAAVLARRDTLAAVMKNKIPSITIGLDLGDKKHAICVLNQAKLPVAIRNHGPGRRQQRLGAAAPNPPS